MQGVIWQKIVGYIYYTLFFYLGIKLSMYQCKNNNNKYHK